MEKDPWEETYAWYKILCLCLFADECRRVTALPNEAAKELRN